MSNADRKRKTLDLPVDLIERTEARAKRNQRTFTGQLIVDQTAYLDREDRLAADMASVELQTR